MKRLYLGTAKRTIKNKYFSPLLKINFKYRIKDFLCFRVWITNLHSWGKAYASVATGSVQIKKLNLDYTLQNVKVGSRFYSLISAVNAQFELAKTRRKKCFWLDGKLSSLSLPLPPTHSLFLFLSYHSLSCLLASHLVFITWYLK